MVTRFLSLALCLTALAVLAPSSAFGSSAYWGANIGSHLTGGAPPYDMAAADTFERMVGKRMSLMAFSLPWAACPDGSCTFNDFPTAQMDAVRERGAIPVFGWASYAQPLTADQTPFRLSTIASGAHDAFLRSWARQARAWGHPFFLNFDWEMNLNGVWPYSEALNGNRPGDFVRMWRHVHDIFREEHADNVTWTWCPNIAFPGSLNLRKLYPGDAYVDWTCIDGYTWYYRWTSFGEMLGPTYDMVQAIAPHKPLLIGETAATEIGGSKPGWIAEMLNREIPGRFVNVRGFLWFEQHDPDLREKDPQGWVVESSPGAQAAFASGISSPFYADNRFADLAGAPIRPLSSAPRPRVEATGTRRCVKRRNARGALVFVCRRDAILRDLTVKTELARTLERTQPELAEQAGIAFTITRDAQVRLRFERRTGRRWAVISGVQSFDLTKGQRGIAFSGRASPTGTMPPGRYRVTLTPVDRAGRTGKPASGEFVLRSPAR